MRIRSTICPKTCREGTEISLPYLSVFSYESLCGRSSYENTTWALFCPNIYSFLTRGDCRRSHIREVSWLNDTYKTATSNVIYNSEQVMEERFIFNLVYSLAKMQHILDNRVITNKELLSAL